MSAPFSLYAFFLVLIPIATAARAEVAVVARGEEGWHFWDKGEQPPQEWMTAAFDDTEWEEGKAPLGYGEDDIATAISFGGQENNKHAVAYFRLAFAVEDPTAHPQWLAELRCDDGAAVYLNGEEVYRYNMPSGELREGTFAAGKLSSARNRESHYHAFYLEPEELQEGENLLAISVHQSDSGSSDLVLDIAVSGLDEKKRPAVKPLMKDGVLESDGAISTYIDAWGKHLLRQERAPIPNGFASQLRRDFVDRELRLTSPSEIPVDAESLYDRCAPSVLILSAVSESPDAGPGHAGAFVISADGLALTNHHVMESFQQADIVVATTLAGRVVRVKEIIASDEDDDVALIQLDGHGFQPAAMATSARVGADLFAISHPRNAFYTLTKGQLARHTRERDRHRLMVTSEFALGSSGSPIFDRFGSVVGMVEMTRSIAYNTVPVHEEEGALKLGRRAEGDRGLFLSMNHQMTLRFAVPCQSMRAFLLP